MSITKTHLHKKTKNTKPESKKLESIKETSNIELDLREPDSADKFVNSLSINYDSVKLFSIEKQPKKSNSLVIVKAINQKRKQCVAGTSEPELIIDKLMQRIQILQDEISEIYKPGVLTTIVGTKFKLKRAEEEYEEVKKLGFYDDEIEFKEAVVKARRIQEAQQMAMLINKTKTN